MPMWTELLENRLAVATLTAAFAAVAMGGVAAAQTLDAHRTLESSACEGPAWCAKDASYREQIGRAPKKTERGFVIGDHYKDAAMVESLLQGYHERYPDVTSLHRIATTHLGLPVWALRITDNPSRTEDEPAVLLVGSIHGDELITVNFALDAVQQILERSNRDPERRWIAELDIWVVPLANPDGNFTTLRVETCKQCGRKNGRDNDSDGSFHVDRDGVDLNRNFDIAWGRNGGTASSPEPTSHRFRGPRAGSEPESQALADLAQRMRFVAALSWHTNGNMILSPYTIDGLHNPEPDVAWQVAEQLAEASGRQPNGKKLRVKRSMYPVEGVEQDWYFHEHGTLAYIIEASHHNPTRRSTRRASVAAIRPIMRALLDRLLEGPSIHGLVTDAQGRPVEAEVQIDKIRTRSGERWTSRQSDGRYERLLPGPGRYTVRAKLPTVGEVSRTVDIRSERVRVDLRIDGAKQ